MKSYIGDRNEVIVGRASGVAPDGSAVMVIARTSTTYGNGVVVMRAQDGLNWTSEFLSMSTQMAGCGYDPATNTVYVVEANQLSNILKIRTSTDYGLNWTVIDSDLGAPVGSPWAVFTSVWFDTSRSRLVISTNSRINLLAGTKTALQSKDGGVTWTAFHTNLISNGTFAGVSFARNAPNPLFVRATSFSGTGTSIYKSNRNDDTLEEMDDVITTTIPVSAGYELAYSPLSKTYVAPNGLTSGSSPTAISFNLEPDGAPRQVTVVSGNLNSPISYIVWSDEDSQFFASCQADSASTDPALYRTFKSVYGGGGWIYDAAPIYNIQNRFGVSMFYDDLRKLVQIYSHGYTAAQRIQLGYLGRAGALPTPTPTTTQSATPTPTATMSMTPTPSPINVGGLVWVGRTSPKNVSWSSVIWAKELGLFVAVADDTSNANSIATSPEGINWTLRTGPATIQWQSVTWSAELGLLVAVSITDNNVIATSPDGINWTRRTVPGNFRGYGITWIKELAMFVAVGQGGNNVPSIITSTDGINWTVRVTATTTVFYKSVVWSPELNRIVVTSNSTNTLLYSSDGINWTTTSAPDLTSSMAWSPQLGKFLGVRPSSGNAIISTDGINWTTTPLTKVSGWNATAWSPDLELFVVLSNSGTNRSITSSDGITWNQWPDTVADVRNTNSVVWSLEKFMFCAVSQNGSIMTGQSTIVPIPTPTATPTPTVTPSTSVSATPQPTPPVTPTGTPSGSPTYQDLFYHESNITNYGA